MEISLDICWSVFVLNLLLFCLYQLHLMVDIFVIAGLMCNKVCQNSLACTLRQLCCLQHAMQCKEWVCLIQIPPASDTFPKSILTCSIFGTSTPPPMHTQPPGIRPPLPSTPPHHPWACEKEPCTQYFRLRPITHWVSPPPPLEHQPLHNNHLYHHHLHHHWGHSVVTSY